MGILGRLSTVIKSNLNSLVDKAEDPDKLISQTIADMESELKRARRELVSTLGAAKRLEKQAEEQADEARDWEEKAVLALKQGDDDLAREALRRKARALKEEERIRGQSADQSSAADEMKSALSRVEEKIEELKVRKTSLASQVRRSRTSGSSPGAAKASAFDELERMVDRIDQLDAEAEAHDVLGDRNRAELDARFRQLEKSAHGDGVEDELAELKKMLDK